MAFMHLLPMNQAIHTIFHLCRVSGKKYPLIPFLVRFLLTLGTYFPDTLYYQLAEEVLFIPYRDIRSKMSAIVRKSKGAI